MKKLVLLIAALALFAAACGGSDGDGGSSGGGTLSASEWCDYNEQVDGLELFGESADFNSFESSIQGFLSIVDEVEDRAPEEIKDDIAVVAQAMADLDEVLSEVDYDFLALSESDLEGLDDPAVEEASDNISNYADENCGTGSDSSDDDDSSDEPEDEATAEPEDDVSDDSGDTDDFDPNDSFRQIMVDSFVQAGMTEEQATCIVNGIDMDTLTSGDFDPFAFLDLYEDCGVNLADLG
jgi:hypothetical protein